MISGICSKLLRLSAKVFGRRLVDERDGQVVGKAIVVMWRGRIYFLGLESSRPLFPFFRDDGELKYWRRVLAFRSHEEPDFPNERADD